MTRFSSDYSGYNTKFKKQEFLAKTTLALGAYCQFKNLKGICFTFNQRFSRAGMNNRTRDVVCTLVRADSTLSHLLWSGLVWSDRLSNRERSILFGSVVCAVVGTIVRVHSCNNLRQRLRSAYIRSLSVKSVHWCAL